MKLIMKAILFILSFVTASMTFAQSTSSLDKDTTIEFKETTVDYGKIDKGSDGVRTFEFTNTGEHPLKIYSIYSACSCDIVYQPEEPIMPGESERIDVKYDTKKIGPIVKTITVVANTKDKLIPLNLKGEVLETEVKE